VSGGIVYFYSSSSSEPFTCAETGDDVFSFIYFFRFKFQTFSRGECADVGCCRCQDFVSFDMTFQDVEWMMSKVVYFLWDGFF
jgi:hypothetical protein